MILNSNNDTPKMRQLEQALDLDSLLELDTLSVGQFCDDALNADALYEELEEYGPFAPMRKLFCQFLDIGESTLTGWLKSGRVPRPARVAYVLLVGLQTLQAEIKKLRQDAQELKIVDSGENFQLVRFDTDDTGVSIGRIVARDIADAKTARVLAGSLKAYRTLQETRYVIQVMLERTDNTRFIDELKDLDNRIVGDTLSAFDPDKWRELFGPIKVPELDISSDVIDTLLAERSTPTIPECDEQSGSSE